MLTVGSRSASAELPHERADGRGRVLGLAGGAHQPAADDHPVGAGVGRGRAPAPGSPMPKPTATGTSVLAAARATSAGSAAVEAAPARRWCR